MKKTFTHRLTPLRLIYSMLKTRKSIAKRFKLTAGGKVLRRTAGLGHLLRHKSVKRRRRASLDKAVSVGFASHVRAAMPYGQ